jgi:diguanylate cyclase (GGDEF)-like protein
MLQRLQAYVISALTRRHFDDISELHPFVISHMLVVFCLVVHVYLCIVFASFASTVFAWINVGSILVYLSLFYQIRRRRYTLIWLVVSGEIVLYVTLHAYLAGLSTYVGGYYLMLVLILSFDNNKNRLYRGIIVVIVVFTGVALALDVRAPSSPFSVVFPDNLEHLLRASNLYMIVVGAFLEVYSVNFVREMIETYREAHLADLSTQAHKDALTGLYNRRYAELYFAKASADCVVGQHSIAMIDIDDFKRINDTNGHAVGDEVLRFLADFLRSNMRKRDILFRWGGEEFLIVLEDTGLDTAYLVLDKLRERLCLSEIPTERGTLTMTVTVGLAPFDPHNPAKSIEYSDANLYLGKRGTKNTVVK